MQIHIVRHGQTEWNVARRIQGHADSALDATGRQQARECGKRLADTSFVAAWISPLGRTRETADLLLAGREDIPRHYDDGLKEITLGDWDGALWEDVQRDDPVNAERLRQGLADFDVPGAETHQALTERALRALDNIIAHHRQSDDAVTARSSVLIVSHGAWIKNLLLGLLDIPVSNRLAYASIPNCSRSVVAVGENGVLEVRDVADGLWDIGAR